MRTMEAIFVFILVCLIMVAANIVGYSAKLDAPLMDSLIGMGVIVIIGIIGIVIAKIPVLNKIPIVAWVTSLAILASSSIFPGHEWILKVTNKVAFMAIATPILAYAGLSVGKDLEIFKKLSWRIVPVALAVFSGTFIFAAIIAHFALKWEGVI